MGQIKKKLKTNIIPTGAILSVKVTLCFHLSYLRLLSRSAHSNTQYESQIFAMNCLLIYFLSIITR